MTMTEKTRKKSLAQYRYEDEYRSYSRKWNSEYRKKKLDAYNAASTIDQRKAFIESIRAGEKFEAAMAFAGITDKEHARDVYYRNLKKKFYYTLADPDKVK